MDSRLHSGASSNLARHSPISPAEQSSMAETMANHEAPNINVTLHESPASMLPMTGKAASPIFSSACRRHGLVRPNHPSSGTCKPRSLIRASVISVAGCASRCSNGSASSLHVSNTILLQFAAGHTRIWPIPKSQFPKPLLFSVTAGESRSGQMTRRINKAKKSPEKPYRKIGSLGE